MLLGCIADDLTGASDLANNLARSGMRVALRVGIPSGAADDVDAIVVSLKSRTAPVDEAVARGAPAEVTIGDVHVWDLVGAMSRVLAKREKRRPRQIVHDDTPIETHIGRIEALLAGQGRAAFTELFDAGMPRSRVVGIFLAVLELVRRGRVVTRQERLFDEIWLEPAPQRPAAPRESA